ncbi:MAG: hypothetical protein Q4D79_11095 [Propionibacteriaceae bacterium]|nr:hypothetical protein [Propionibacteriaceae bacterium]
MNSEVPHNDRRFPRRTLLLATALATGCSLTDVPEDRSQLPLMLEDPLADKNLLGLPLIKEEEKGYTSRMGKPSHAKITRVFQINPTQARETFDAALAIAWETDWETANPTSQHEERTLWFGEKEDPPRYCSIFIGDENPAELLIEIHAGEEPRHS